MAKKRIRMVNDGGQKNEKGRMLEKVFNSKGKMLCKENFTLLS